jgi:hypothetical protein
VTHTENGWSEYQRLVLSELKRLDSDINDLSGKVDRVRMDVAMIKVKIGLWGILGGCIPAAIALGYTLLQVKAN